MRLPRLLTILGMLITLTACASLQSPTFTTATGAIRGYDAVAYHTEGMPVQGDAAYTHEFNGAVWHFASAENRDLFRNDPARYAPQYGGYCAYAMSKGFVVSTDPEAWAIEDGKLYLNYSPSVRKTWLKDVPGHIARADEQWQDKTSRSIFE